MTALVLTALIVLALATFAAGWLLIEHKAADLWQGAWCVLWCTLAIAAVLAETWMRQHRRPAPSHGKPAGVAR